MTKRATWFLLLVLAVLTTGVTPAPSTPLKPADYQPYIASVVADYLVHYHYRRAPLDDEMSEHILTEYLDSLDYNHLFFLQSDIESFRAFQHRLDDDLLEDPADLSHAFLIFNRYRERVEERMVAVQALLDKGFDFSIDETYDLDRHEKGWAGTPEELNDIWRRRLKEDVIRFRLRGKPEQDAIDLLKKRYVRLLHTVRQFDESDVLEEFLSSAARCFDPHSAYLRPITRENFDIELGQSLEGIGASLRREAEYTVVVDLIKGGPAERSGQLAPRDKIIAVAQGDGEFEDVVDMRLDNVVKKIRGPKGTVVRLTIIPADARDPSETREVRLVRDRIEITANDPKVSVHPVQTADGRTLQIGVIEIPSFVLETDARNRGDPNYKSTTRQVKPLLENLKRQGVDGLVLDLRKNGGGALDEAVALTGLFIDRGPIVQIRSSHGQVQVQEDRDGRMAYGGPLMVLTSVLSASASEILAGAIQDYDRGLIVGSTTHGKGTVQNLISLETPLMLRMRRPPPDDVAGSLKITTFKFYRVSGSSTQHKGVHPDVTLPSPYDALPVGEDQLEYALPWDEIEPVTHRSYGLPRAIIPELQARSQARVAANPEFKYLEEDNAYLRESQEKTEVSLNYEVRLKEKEALDAREAQREKERKARAHVASADAAADARPGSPDSEQEKKEHPGASDAASDAASDTRNGGDAEDAEDRAEENDFILDESLNIMADFITLQGGRTATR